MMKSGCALILEMPDRVTNEIVSALVGATPPVRPKHVVPRTLMSNKRIPALNDVPTIVETGYASGVPDVWLTGWLKNHFGTR